MNHYTQLNINNKKPENAIKPEGTNVAGAPRKTMMWTGLVLATALSGGVLLIGNGCAKAKNADTKAQTIPSSSPTPTSTMSTVTANTAPQPVAPKVIKKKRPSAVTFNDTAYGVSFVYPRRYSLKTGDKAIGELAEKEPIPMDFTQPGGITIAAIELPKNSYPGTDLHSALFNVNVHRSLSASECEQFGSPTPGHPGSTPPSRVLVGETEFSQFEDVSTEKNSETRYYHVFENGTCYEFALGLGVSDIVSENEVTPVNRQDVFGKLEKIMSTVRVKAIEGGEVATTTTTPASGEHQ